MRVRVTLKVTPWHELGAFAASFTRPGMDSVPVVAPALTVSAGEKASGNAGATLTLLVGQRPPCCWRRPSRPQRRH